MSEFADLSWLSRFGMYRIKSVCQNNVSSLTLPDTWVQVGDNVTLVDVYVADWLVAVGAPVSLTIVCPTGWPVILTVDMGDGQPPQRITRPSDYDPQTENRPPRRRITPPSVTAAVPTTTTPAGPVRQRRSVDETSTFGQPFRLSYQYRTPGSYMYVYIK